MENADFLPTDLGECHRLLLAAYQQSVRLSGLPHEWWALREERKLLVRRMEDVEVEASESS